MGAMTEIEALTFAIDFADKYGLCETQRSRLLTTIRVFFFELDPPTMKRETLDRMLECYTKKKTQSKKLKIIGGTR